MNNYVAALREVELQVFPEQGAAFLPVHHAKQSGYFEEHQHMALTKVGQCLNETRCALVQKYTSGLVLDIGVGGAEFIRAHGNAIGFDVDPSALKWLMQNGKLRNPYVDSLDDVMGFTFWDSLEHIPQPETVLNRIGNQHVFVSMPIIRDITRVQEWKHLKRNEHWMYFTDAGFQMFMDWHGFRCLETNDAECACGREDILSYVFQRPMGESV